MADEKDDPASGEYRVGYGKPPKETQFKKGHQPRGRRRKGTRNYRTVFREQLLQTIDVTTSSGKVKLTLMDAIAKRAVTDAAVGKSPSAVERGLRLIEQYGPTEDVVDWDLSLFTDEELDLFETLLAKITKE